MATRNTWKRGVVRDMHTVGGILPGPMFKVRLLHDEEDAAIKR